MTIENLTVADTFTAPAGPALDVTCPVTSLVVKAQTTCTATYVSTLADFDAGSIENTATADGTAPGGSAVISEPSAATVTVAQAPALSLVKRAETIDKNGNGVVNVGDEISWTFLVTNTGNVTITSIAVTDPTAGAVDCPVVSLAPGEDTTCTAALHVVGQADVDAGAVNNTATAGGNSPCVSAPAPVLGVTEGLAPCGPTTSNASSTSTPTDSRSALAIAKTASAVDVNGDGQVDTGDRIHWTITVTNAGTTTLRAVVVADPTAGRVTCPANTLAPGAKMQCTVADHVITATDTSVGTVRNVATGQANGPDGPVLPPTATASVPVAASPTPPPGSGGLPFTGVTQIGPLLFGGGALVLLGLFLALLGMRRRTEQ